MNDGYTSTIIHPTFTHASIKQLEHAQSLKFYGDFAILVFISDFNNPSLPLFTSTNLVETF
jgi:hypothetical protein